MVHQFRFDWIGNNLILLFMGMKKTLVQHIFLDA